MADKIILKFKTKNILNFYEIEPWSHLISLFSKSLQFWYHKNRHIFLIIILKFHALIPLRLEENFKNSPILLIWWLPPIINHLLSLQFENSIALYKGNRFEKGIL